MKKKFPKGIRKHIRKEKARIRRQILDLKGQKKLINELYKKFAPVSLKASGDALKTLAEVKK